MTEPSDLLAFLPQPWEQLTEESTPAFAAFVRYRDLPPERRTIARAAETEHGSGVGKRRASLVSTTKRYEGYSSKNAWKTRAQQWDAHVDREKRESQIVAAREMGERHAAAAVRVITKGLDALDTINVNEMSVADTLRYIEVGVKLERLARGEVDPDELPTSEEEPVQQTIRSLLESDAEVAKAGARFGAQILRVRREREAE